MMWHEQLSFGILNCPYKYAVTLSRNIWCDLSSFAFLKKKRRQFTIWKWVSGQSPTSGMGVALRHEPFKVSGWIKIFEFSNGKWEKVKDDASIRANNHGAPMMPAHLLFKDEQELRDWIGEKDMIDVFVEVL